MTAGPKICLCSSRNQVKWYCNGVTEHHTGSQNIQDQDLRSRSCHNGWWWTKL